MIFPGRLFWKILLSFCLTVAILLGVGAPLSEWTARKIGQPPRVKDFLQVYARSAVAQYELGGPLMLRKQLQEWSNPFFPHYYLVDATGREVSGASVPGDLAGSFPSVVLLPGQLKSDGSGYQHSVGKWVVLDRIEPGTRGTYYFAVVFHPAALLKKVIQLYFGALGIYASLAFTGCGLLSLYLTRPVAKLREISGRLASGDLEARVDRKIARRTDEIGGLVRDFNTMADGVRDLIESHKNLLADVSHELRSPLARQRVAIALLERLQTEEQRPMLDRVRTESMRLDELIGRILLLCNLESGQQKPDQVEFSLNEAVEQVVEDAEFEMKQTGQAVKYSAASEGVKIFGDRKLLVSAIENILRNSIRYAQPGPIDVDLSAHGDTAILRIRDYGPGMPASQLDKVLRPFYRINRSDAAGGTGLGLAITKRAMNLHGGSIQLRNALPRGLVVELLFRAGR